MCDLKATQMNMQCRLNQELMFIEFEQGHNTEEGTKNICDAKNEGLIDHRWF